MKLSAICFLGFQPKEIGFFGDFFFHWQLLVVKG